MFIAIGIAVGAAAGFYLGKGHGAQIEQEAVAEIVKGEADVTKAYAAIVARIKSVL